MTFDFALIAASVPTLLRATFLTLGLTGASLVLGLTLGCSLGLALISDHPVPHRAARLYSLVFRGTPLLVQLFLIYYGLGQSQLLRDSFLWVLLRQPFWCAVLALALNSAAYTSEIFRGAVNAIPSGQWEAAKALGLGRSIVFWKIIAPQALRIALPSYGNEAVMIVKSTALASTVSMFDLTGAARTIVADTYAPYEIFVTSGLIYLALTAIIQAAFTMLERRLKMAGAARSPSSKAKRK